MTYDSPSSEQHISTIVDDAWPNAIYGAQNPAAYYAESVDKTFITYRGDDADPYATTYDHESGTITPPAKVGTNPLPNDDKHGPPAITVDDNGIIHCSFGGHNNQPPPTMARSVRPYDTSEWEVMGKINDLGAVAGTYPSMACYQGDVYALLRSGKGHANPPSYPQHCYGTIVRTTDGGDSWEDLGPIIDVSDHPDEQSDAYVSDLDVFPDGRLHISWTVAHGTSHNDTRTSAYHAFYDPDGNNGQGTMNALGGGTKATPINFNSFDSNTFKAFDNTEGGMPKHVGSDDGTVYLSYCSYNASEEVVERYLISGDYDSGEWSSEKVPGAESMGIYTPDFPRIADDGSVELWAVTVDDRSGNVRLTSNNVGKRREGDIRKFVKQNGEWESELIADRSIVGDSGGWNPAQGVKNGTDEFPAIIAEDRVGQTPKQSRLEAVIPNGPSELPTMPSDSWTPLLGATTIDSGEVRFAPSNAPSDDTWKTNSISSKNVTFNKEFGSPPTVTTALFPSLAGKGTCAVRNITTDGFEVLYFQFSTNRSVDEYPIYWIAAE